MILQMRRLEGVVLVNGQPSPVYCRLVGMLDDEICRIDTDRSVVEVSVVIRTQNENVRLFVRSWR